MFELLVYHLIPLVSLLVFLAGSAWRLYRWRATPIPFKVPLTPAPGSPLAGLRRLGIRAALFPTLLRSDPWLWPAAWLFHLSLLMVIIGHLRLWLAAPPVWLAWLTGLAGGAGLVLAAAGIFLLFRRLLLPRLALVSRPGDYLALILILLVTGTGLALRLGFRVDLVGVKDWGLAWLAGDWSWLPPPSPLLILHLLSASLLVALIPFTRLGHGLMILFNPVLTQLDDARAFRHPNPWEGELADLAPPARDSGPGGHLLPTLEDYRRRLEERWRAGGREAVLSARERARARGEGQEGGDS